MAVQKNFVIRNGIEVNSNLLVADVSTDHVGIGTSVPKNKLEVIGGIGATHINILGISTVVTEFNVGTAGTVITSLDTGVTGFGTALPEYIVDIRSPVSTGQTALYVQGDVKITGDLQVDDIFLDQATFNNIEVTGVGTITTASIDLGYVKTGVVTSLVTTGIASISVGVVADAYITTGIVTNLSVSGIGSISTASVDLAYVKTGIVTNLINTGISSIATGVVTTAYIRTGIITTLSGSNLTYSGIGTINTASIDLAYVKTGIVTSLVTTGIASISVGVVTDAYITTGIVTNLSVSGIGTLATASIDLAYVKTGIVTNLSTSGIGTINTASVDLAYVKTGIVTNLSVSGIGSISTASVDLAYVKTGIVTNLSTSGIGTINTASVDLAYVKTGIVTNLSTSGIGTINTAVVNTAYVKTGIVTNLSTSGIGTINTAVVNTAYVNTGIITNLSGTNLNYSGVGTVTNLRSTNLTVSGVTTVTNLAVNGTFDSYAADSTFHGNVTIDGNITIGGTSSIINAVELRVEDKDLVIGFTTSQTPSDDTGNHGGIAIASTEGTPLVSLAVAGINTLPDTYKQIMWVKRNTMGAGTTDAFLFNYGVGIGSTQVPNGVRLAVGSVQVTDNTISATSAVINNLSISGIITSGGYNVGIQSGGTNITTGVITALNFIGAGNTFLYRPGDKIVDINIGGSQWTFSDPTNPTTSSIYRVNGNVGIGTTNAGTKLNVWGTVAIGDTTSTIDSLIPSGNPTILRILNNQPASRATAIIVEAYTQSLGSEPGITLRRARGTLESPSQLLAGDRFGFVVGSGFGTTSFVNPAAINFIAQEDFTESARGSYIQFQTTDIGATSRTEKVRITANGSVGIGTTNPSGKLEVQGGDLYVTNSSDPRVYIQNTGSGGAGFDIRKSDGTWAWRFTAEPEGFKVKDHLNSLDKFYIEDGATGNVWFNNIQNVGIGTTNPAEKLTVVGDTLLSGEVGIGTTSINTPQLVGVGNSFNGVYISNGMILVDNTLEGDHYIGTAYNGLMAGPVTINGTLTVDGNYVVV
jgi:hypothetical protein